MADIPLIPGPQQTYARFRRRRKKSSVDFDKAEDDNSKRRKRSFKRRLAERRQRSMSIKLERRAFQDRRNQQAIKQSNEKDRDKLPGKGRHINTTA